MNSKMRQSAYLLSTMASGIVGLLLLWSGIDSGTASGLNEIIGGLGALLAGGGPALASRSLRKQESEGMFKDISPADQVISSVKTVMETRDAALAEVDRVRQAVSDSVGNIPVLGPLAQQAINLTKQGV